MSDVLDAFKNAAANGNWPDAIRYCNGLNMYEMLRGLNGLPRRSLDDMKAQLGLVADRYFVDRIAWAMEVVATRRLPATAPGDLQGTGQVQDAKNFLTAVSGAAAGHLKKLKVAFFWTRNAQNETASSGLVQKAQELLRANGNEFTLDVLRVRTVLPFDRTLSDADEDTCQSAEFVEVQQLAERSAAYSADRLPIIFYISETVLDARGNVRPANSHGCGYQPSAKRGFAMINARSVATDRVTLLHELGHGAGLKHEPDGTGNVMTYDAVRTKINPIQLVKLSHAYFCRA